MDSIVLASIIGAIATLTAAVISHVVTRRVSHKRVEANKPVANFLHAQRDYTRTQRRLERMLSGFVNTDRKPDLYITNFGTPVSILKHCRGYADYQAFLVELSRSKKCVLHRYYVITKEPDLLQHIRDIVQRNVGHTDANVFCCDSSPFGEVGETIVNFLALSDTFAAVTFETSSKVVLSMHTTDAQEVAALIEVIRSVELHCKKVLAIGRQQEAI